MQRNMQCRLTTFLYLLTVLETKLFAYYFIILEHINPKRCYFAANRVHTQILNMKVKNSILSAVFLISSLLLFSNCSQSQSNKAAKPAVKDTAKKVAASAPKDTVPAKIVYPPLDKKLYDSLMKRLAHGDTTGKWPVKNAPYPLPGAILPFKRVVAFYGNLYAKKMGILGELPPNEMLAKLKGEVKNWQRADPQTPVQPALHYIAVVASGSPGKDGMYVA